MSENRLLNTSENLKIQSEKNNINSSIILNHCMKKSQKIISSLFMEKEDIKIIVALDNENILYVWYLKLEIIEALSFLDDLESEEKKNIFPNLSLKLDDYIRTEENLSVTKRILITNFKYLVNSNDEFIFISGNFNTILIKTEDFYFYLKEELDKNMKDLNNLNNFVLQDTSHYIDENELLNLENGLKDNTSNEKFFQFDKENFTINNPIEDKKVLKIFPFKIPKDKLINLNDFGCYKHEKEINSPIIDLILIVYNSLEENNKYLISFSESNTFLIFSMDIKEFIMKFTIPHEEENSTNLQKILSMAVYDLNKTTNSIINLAIGTSNGLLFLYMIDLEKLSSKNHFNLRGIFSIFLNELISKEQFSKLKNLTNEEFGIVIEEFFQRNSKKNIEPINFIKVKDNILYAGLESFVIKYNLSLMILTQILPCLGSVNKIILDEENIFIISNNRFILNFELRGVLKTKIESSMSCIFNLERFKIKTKDFYSCSGDKNFIEIFNNDSSFKLVI